MKFSSKLMHVAVLGALGAAATGAQAVNLGDDNTGEVLLYPYYSVQGGNDTLISVVNSTNAGKAVKVRVLESLNSKEVIDFNLYLSPKDVWTAAITADAATGGAKLVTTDKSCTVPEIPTVGSQKEVSFVNYQYVAADDGPEALTRTREGYIEIIEMGTVNNTFVLGTTTFGPAITHVNGVPPGCAAVVSGWTAVTGAFVVGANELTANSGGLFGSGTIINVAEGTDYSYDPVAIAAFNDTALGNHQAPGSTAPSLNDVVTGAGVANSVVFYNGAALTTDWAATAAFVSPVDAVSAVLMRRDVMNEYTVNTALASGTDMVVTFPTKAFYVAQSATAAPFLGDRPFTTNFVSAAGSATGACEPVGLSATGREEEVAASVLGFSPPPPGAAGNALCWEANVVTMNNSNVLKSANALNINPGYTDGWLTMSFTNAGHLMVDDTALAAVDTYNGLPVIGFAVQKYVNGSVGGVLSNYGGSFAHKYLRLIN